MAITRGKLAVWVVGSSTTLKSSRDKHWGALIEDAEQRQLFVRSEEDPHLKRALVSAAVDSSNTADRITQNLIRGLTSGAWQVGCSGSCYIRDISILYTSSRSALALVLSYHSNLPQ